MKATFFTPDKPQYLQCLDRSQGDSPASKHIQAAFAQLGAGVACDNPVRSDAWPSSDGGIANIMSSFYKTFLCAFRSNRAVVTPTLSTKFAIYDTHSGCGLLCYFKPFSDCDTSASNRTMSMQDIFNLQRPCHFSRKGRTKGAEALPTDWQSGGWFWMMSQIMLYLWRPNIDLAARIKQAKESLGLYDSSRYIGLHVRRGDVCTSAEERRTRRSCDKLEKYMPHARKLRSLYGLSTIFLATDDSSVLADTAFFPEFKFVFQKEAFRTPTAAEHWKDGEGTIQEKNVAVLIDLFILSDSSALVGKFSSR
jgi:hypothetical protein